MTNFTDVCRFHRHFQVPVAEEPSLLDDETYRFRFKFMLEELTEFTLAHERGDLAEAADALIDLVYVAMGTADLMGLPWEKLWDDVQRANLAKERVTDASQSKRGSALDVRKPEGWVGPKTREIIDQRRNLIKGDPSLDI